MSRVQDDYFQLEKQFILRAPPKVADSIREKIHKCTTGEPGDPFNISFINHDPHHAHVEIDNQRYPATLVNLPCIIESQKSFDNKTFFKTADISQMLIVHEQDETPLHVYDRDSGITPPTRKIRRRRWRHRPYEGKDVKPVATEYPRSVCVELIKTSDVPKRPISYLLRAGSSNLEPVESLPEEEKKQIEKHITAHKSTLAPLTQPQQSPPAPSPSPSTQPLSASVIPVNINPQRPYPAAMRPNFTQQGMNTHFRQPIMIHANYPIGMAGQIPPLPQLNPARSPLVGVPTYFPQFLASPYRTFPKKT
ncbi:putative transcription initiation factor TFIID subunit 7 [Blattamonas nauphoetae]|uniref:Transcription initiation factor TFIID subunit 7 n=1 Tax=Blattamonas nauphoetae TaxID=2049346 RepID=A0ABQ9XNJ9_9EUKA|nr:putative transcription initiation factor TFIID subunit 7 [Blattamonas nauphoetae]